MPSKVEALVRNYLRTDADALFLVPGERMFLMKGVQRAVVGREPLSLDSFLAVSDELAPGEAPEALAQRHFRVPLRLDAASQPVEVRFGTSGSSASIMIARAASVRAEAGASPEPLPPAPQPEPAPPREPARSPQAAPAQRRGASPPPEPEALEYGEVTSVGNLAPPPPPPDVDALEVPASLSSRAFSAVGAAAPAPQLGPRPAAAAAAVAAVAAEDALLLRMLEMGASDLHLAVGTPPVFRVDGELVQPSGAAPLGSADVERLLRRLLPEPARSALAARNEATVAAELAGVARLRVHAFRDRRGPCLAIRLVPRQLPTPRQLGLPDAALALAEAGRGLVVVTGPAGSGRSTTLAALVDHVNRTRAAHVVTVEDPVEFVHDAARSVVNQREVAVHAASRAEALRAALREDADVVLAGELDEREAIDLALEAAQAGILVLASLRAPTAAAAVEQLVDRHPVDRQASARALLAGVLRGIVAVALCRRPGGGRVAAFEVLVANAAVAALVRDGKTSQLAPVLQTSRAQGMQLLNDALVDLVSRGAVEAGEALDRAADRAGLLALLRSNGLPLPPGTAADPGAPPARPLPGTPTKSPAS